MVFPGELATYLNDPLAADFATESLQDCGRRFAAAARTWADSLRHGQLVIVAHQDPIHAGQLELTDRWTADYHANKPEHASVVTLRPEPGKWLTSEYWAPPQGIPFPPFAQES